jgi:YD repeat-containing protein
VTGVCPATATGKLCRARTNAYSRVYSYDAAGLITGTTVGLDGAHTFGVTYDTFGRVATRIYPSGFEVKNVYNVCQGQPRSPQLDRE